ncbi:MAG: ComF family protein [Oscillospiraceae bacterium]|nr:ComF family protein [Oscillospiraceae bacterium]MBQ7130730.1 ComF family protein [Oscillospiraceae bacterium]
MKLIHWIVRLLFPPRCVLCRKVLEQEETDLCRNCRAEAPYYLKTKTKIQFLDSFAAVWYYEGCVRGSLLRYKFHGARSYAPAYGRLLAMKLCREYPEGFDVLTWVPVSRLRRFRRGYDQVELLAGSVGRELGMEPVPALKKIRHNPQQSRIADGAKRRANVLGAYRVTEPEQIRGKRVLLLDDILTTGATAGECARVLLTAGAKEVHCAAVAAAKKHG